MSKLILFGKICSCPSQCCQVKEERPGIVSFLRICIHVLILIIHH